MEDTYGEFYKTILGPTQKYEESIHPATCSPTSCKHLWDSRCKTRSEEMWEWEDYQARQYRFTAPAKAGSNISTQLA